MDAPSTTPTGDEISVDYVVEPIFLSLSLLFFVVYTVQFYFRPMRAASNTVFGFGKRVRGLWVEKIMSDPKNYILGVQTLRNEILVGTFIAKSAFLGITEIKIILLLLLQTGVFIFSVQHLRLLRHLSVQVGNSAGGGQDEQMQTFMVSTCTSMYDRCAVFFFFSMRLMLLSFPAAGWIFGPTACLVTSVVTVLFMHLMDNINIGSKAMVQRIESLPTREEELRSV